MLKINIGKFLGVMEKKKKEYSTLIFVRMFDFHFGFELFQRELEKGNSNFCIQKKQNMNEKKFFPKFV